MTEFNPNLTQRIITGAKKRVIPNWKSRIKDFSTIALASISGISGIWVAMPPTFKSGLPEEVGTILGALVLGLGIFGTVGKFLTQPHAETQKDES